MPYRTELSIPRDVCLTYAARLQVIRDKMPHPYSTGQLHDVTTLDALIGLLESVALDRHDEETGKQDKAAARNEVERMFGISSENLTSPE